MPTDTAAKSEEAVWASYVMFGRHELMCLPLRTRVIDLLGNESSGNTLNPVFPPMLPNFTPDQPYKGSSPPPPVLIVLLHFNLFVLTTVWCLDESAHSCVLKYICVHLIVFACVPAQGDKGSCRAPPLFYQNYSLSCVSMGKSNPA